MSRLSHRTRRLRENPGVFRADFATSDSAVDLALLGRGYHIVTGPVPFNGDGPMREHWDIVYDYLIGRGLAAKAVMSGAGGAAGEAYAWAIEHPDRVSCIYAENPLLCVNSYPTQPLDNLAPLAQAGVPILHLCGALDPWLDGHTRVLEKLYRELGGVVGVIVKNGVGHYPLAPNDIDRVIEFITRAVA